jgi:hypothetical protein
MANERAADQPAPEPSDVKVVTTVIGPDQYRIVATAIFESGPPRSWPFCGTGKASSPWASRDGPAISHG